MVILMWKQKKPVRLEKKETNKEKFQNWVNRHYGVLFAIAIILAIILFVNFCFMFVPGTESGLVYNNRTGVIFFATL